MPDSTYDQQHGFYLEDLSVGMHAIYAKTMTEADVTLFAGLSGDTNPLHINEEFASKTRFQRRIVPGMLTASLWSTLVGTQLPGPGSAYMSQNIRFVKPVYIGDTVTAHVVVTKIDHAKQRLYLSAECRVADAIVAAGQAMVWVPRRIS
jgi:3-hydroxybutyryl-CoA dehydratase